MTPLQTSLEDSKPGMRIIDCPAPDTVTENDSAGAGVFTAEFCENAKLPRVIRVKAAFAKGVDRREAGFIAPNDPQDQIDDNRRTDFRLSIFFFHSLNPI